jgi:predicted MFS family arabinose efflux permease
MTGSGLATPFLNVFFQETYALPVAHVGLIMAAGQWVAALGVAASGEAAHRLGPRPTLALWLLLLGPTLWLLAGAHALAAAVPLFLVFGVIAPAAFPLVDQLLLEGAPPERHGLVSGLRNVATEGSGALGASAGGVILRAWGFDALFGAAGAVSAAAALGALALLGRRRRAADVPALAAAEGAD